MYVCVIAYVCAKNLNIYIHRRKAGGEIESKSFKLQLESLQSNLLYIQ